VSYFVGIAMTIAAGSFALTGAEAGEKPRAVLELFTSQGCSSCPPADALMNQLVEDRSLLALTFPVDYWDYLGWKDTFARPEYTQRQRGYAAGRHDRAVYTPQIVVNGREHVVGSNQAAIERTVASHERMDALPVDLDLDIKGDVVVARVGGSVAGVETKATLWLVTYDLRRSVPIARGENKGRTVVYSHVVRQVQAIGMWKGQSMTVELPRHELMPDRDVGMAIMLQPDRDSGLGPILGAAMLTGPSS